MIIKTYEDFLNEEINLRKKLIGGAIGLSTLVPNSIHSKDLGTNKDTIVNTNHSYELNKFVDSIRLERPELFTAELEAKVREMFRKAVELESEWGSYITNSQILGFNDKIITQYIQHLADKRLQAVGYKPEYNVSHPIPWVDGYASFNDQRTNFFEGNVVNYSKGSIDFDDF